jgi:zinc protease
MDPAVRLSRLDNGLTVYVLKHGYPPARASLRLVVKAGSVLEEENQRGVAHLVEHMAFNGSTHFPNDESTHFLQSMGMSPGVHFNAMTTFEHTDYKLVVPTDAHGALQKGLSFLRDVAHDVSFEPRDLDDERGVVLEEWRMQRGAEARLQEAEWANVLQGSRYASSLPIGLPEVIRGVARADVLRFYRDWYRPDNMAVVAVGDFDPALVEAEIKRQFGDIPRATSPRALAWPTVPRDRPLRVEVERDPEASSSTIVLRDLGPRPAKLTKRDYRTQLVEHAVMLMLEWRLVQERGDDDSVLRSVVQRADLGHDASALTCTIVAKEGQIDAALRTLVSELGSAARYGFRQNELNRASQTMLAGWDHRAGEATQRRSESHAAELSRNFLDGEQVQGPGIENAWVHELVPTITLDDVDGMARLHGGERGRVVSLKVPTNVFVPPEARLRSIIASAAKDPPGLPPYEAVDKPLLAALPTPGPVVEETTDAKLGLTQWKLMNGLRVVLKRSPVPGNNVRVEGWSSGGTSLLSDADYAQARFAGAIMDTVGAGELSERQLRQVLAGKEVSLNLRLTELGQAMSLNSTPDDLETALQLLYLKLTRPGSGKAAFGVWMKTELDRAHHRGESPQALFADAIAAATSPNDARRAPASVEMIERVQLERVRAIWLERSSNFNGATFVVVGNVEPGRLKGLVERYLGSLPSRSTPDRWKDLQVGYPTATVERTVTAGREARSRVFLEFSAAEPWSLESENDIDAFKLLLHRRLDTVLRERMSSTYFVGVNAGLRREPTPRHYLRINFDCAPENVDKMRTAIFTELEQLRQNGVDAEYLDTLGKQLRRQHEESQLSDEWWLHTLERVNYFGDDLARLNDIDAVVARLTNQNVQAAAKRLFDPQKYVLVVQNPVTLPALPPKP